MREVGLHEQLTLFDGAEYERATEDGGVVWHVAPTTLGLEAGSKLRCGHTVDVGGWELVCFHCGFCECCCDCVSGLIF